MTDLIIQGKEEEKKTEVEKKVSELLLQGEKVKEKLLFHRQKEKETEILL